LLTLGVACGGGMSVGVILRLIPGASPIAVCRGAGQNGRGLTKGRDCRDADEGCRPNADLNCKYPIDVPQRQDSESLRCSGLKLDASTDVYQETARFTIAPRTGSWHGYISP
jgi:hypothetical protein